MYPISYSDHTDTGGLYVSHTARAHIDTRDLYVPHIHMHQQMVALRFRVGVVRAQLFMCGQQFAHCRQLMKTAAPGTDWYNPEDPEDIRAWTIDADTVRL